MEAKNFVNLKSFKLVMKFCILKFHHLYFNFKIFNFIKHKDFFKDFHIIMFSKIFIQSFHFNFIIKNFFLLIILFISIF